MKAQDFTVPDAVGHVFTMDDKIIWYREENSEPSNQRGFRIPVTEIIKGGFCFGSIMLWLTFEIYVKLLSFNKSFKNKKYFPKNIRTWNAENKLHAF